MEMLFSEFRELFPVMSESTYLDSAQRGLTPSIATQAACQVLQAWESLDPERVSRLLPDQVKHKLAALLKVEPDELALTGSTANGLNTFAGAIDWQPGDNVVLSEAEHASNFYPWLHLRERGVEVRLVPCADGIMRPEEYESYLDNRTRIVAASLVSFYPGALLEARGLSRIAHQAGALLVLDAVQAVGILPVYPRQLGADALAAAAYKGLMSPYGGGFLYVRRELLPRLKPQQLYLGNVEGEYGIIGGAYTSPNYSYTKGAEVLEQGAESITVLAQMDKALDLILDLSVEKIGQHVCDLASELVSGLVRLGYTIDTPQDDSLRRHIVCVRMQDGYGLVKHLFAHNIRASARRFGLRMGLHAYNSLSDVERVLEVLAEYPARR